MKKHICPSLTSVTSKQQEEREPFAATLILPGQDPVLPCSPLPSQHTLTTGYAAKKISGKLTKAVHAGVLQGIALCEATKHDTPEAEARREGLRAPRLARATRLSWCRRERQGSFLMHGGGKRYRKAKSMSTVEPFTCRSAVRHQWKLMGLSST